MELKCIKLKVTKMPKVTRKSYPVEITDGSDPRKDRNFPFGSHPRLKALFSQNDSFTATLGHFSHVNLFEFDLRTIQPDIVNVQCSRTAGRRSAFAAQTDGNLIHVGQVDPLVGKGL